MRKILLPFLFFLPTLLFADGMALMVVGPTTYKSKIFFVQQNSQYAIINYEDGIEKMMITMTTISREKDVYWLLPVPAPPHSLKMEIVMTMPILSGYELTSWGEDMIKKARIYALCGQIYPIPFVTYHWLATRGRLSRPSFAGIPGAMFPGAKLPPLVVHQHIEKGGMVAEKITAKEPNALYQYLRSKGLSITKGTIPILDYYIGKDYTFIVAWLSQTYTGQEEAQGLYLKFPTEKIYYPLYPMSVYGGNYVRVDLYLIGFCQPIPDSLKAFPIKADYCLGNFEDPYALPADFFRGNKKNVPFTNINLWTEASSFTSDLWISPHPPFKALYALFFVIYHFPILFISFVIASLLSAFLIGRMIYPGWNTRALLSIGLLNLFTIIPVIFGAIFFLKSEEKKEPEALKELVKKGYPYGRLDSVILFFLSAFLFLLAINTPTEPSFPGTAFAVFFTFIVAFLLQRIKRKDEELFSQLIQAGYSPYFFVPQSRAKPLFIFLFSLAFILIFAILTSFLRIPLH